jgi:hypothetical protein
MRKLLIVMFLLLSCSAFGEVIEFRPDCTPDGARYQTVGHFLADFCTNGKGFKHPQECLDYGEQIGPDALGEEMNEFAEKRNRELCGK